MKTKEKKTEKVLTDEAKRFKEFRKAENLTQLEMGEALGKDQATIVRYENGEFAIPTDIIKALHHKFQMNINWFFRVDKATRKFVPQKSNLVKDVASIATDQSILENQFNELKREFLKLHNDYHAFKRAN